MMLRVMSGLRFQSQSVMVNGVETAKANPNWLIEAQLADAGARTPVYVELDELNLGLEGVHAQLIVDGMVEEDVLDTDEQGNF